MLKHRNILTRCGVILAAAGLWSLIAAATARAEDVQSYVNDAKARIEKGDLKGAEIQLRNAVREKPDDASVHVELAQLYLKLGNLPAAEAEARLARQNKASPDQVDPVLAEALARQEKLDQLLSTIKPGDRSAKQESRVRVQLGLAHLMLHENNEAEPLLRDAVRLDNGAAEPKIGLARLLILKGETDDAEAELARASAIAPDDPTPMQLSGEILYTRGDVAGALKQFDAVLAQHPQHLGTLFDRANVEMSLGKIDDAQRDLNAGLKIDPKNLLGNFLSALLSSKKGDLKAAEERLISVSAYFNSFPDGYYLQGAVQLGLGEYEQAESNLRKYVARNPNFLPARRLLATIAARKREWSRVIDTLKPVVDTNAVDPESVALLAQAYLAMGNRDKALQLFQTATEASADNSKVQTQLALMQMQVGQAVEGVTRLESLAGNEKSADTAGPILVITKLRSGQATAAAADAEAMVKRNSKDVLAQNLLGMARMAQRNYADAATIFEGIYQRDHNLVQVQRNLAKAYNLLGRREDAAKLWNEILQAKPDDVEAMIALADLANQAKDYDKAVKLLKSAQDASPKDPTAGILRAQVIGEQKDWSNALQVVRDLEGQFPANARVIGLAAQIRAASGDLKGAANEYRNLTQAFPTSAPAYLTLAQAQLLADDKAGARATLEKAISIAPGNSAVVGALVNLDYDEKGLESARTLARSLTQPQPALGALIESSLLLRTQHRQDAIALLAKEQQRRPDARVATRLAQLTFLDGKPDAAEAMLASWLKDHDGDLDVRRELANMKLVQRNFNGATQEYERVVAAAPYDPISLNNLAGLYDRKGDPRAFELAERGYNLAPTPERGDTVGWILVEHGDAQRGLSYLQQAAATAPQNMAIQYHLAVALKATGAKGEARVVLERIMKSDAHFDDRGDAQRLLTELQNG